MNVESLLALLLLVTGASTSASCRRPGRMVCPFATATLTYVPVVLLKINFLSIYCKLVVVDATLYFLGFLFPYSPKVFSILVPSLSCAETRNTDHRQPYSQVDKQIITRHSVGTGIITASKPIG